MADTLNIDPESGREVLLIDAFSYNGRFNVKAKGYQGTATKATTTNIDCAIGTEDRHIQGIRLILRNHLWGDTAVLQIVDKDNVLGLGANTVLNEFAEDWNCVPDTQDQGIVAFSYVARIPANTYLRLVYTSTASALLGVNVDLLINLLLHKKVL